MQKNSGSATLVFNVQDLKEILKNKGARTQKGIVYTSIQQKVLFQNDLNSRSTDLPQDPNNSPTCRPKASCRTNGNRMGPFRKINR
jgi:hypothetical protein